MGSHSYLQNMNTCMNVNGQQVCFQQLYDRTSSAHADQPSYLMNMPTNIGVLGTQGLLNSVANRHTTTNVGELDGSRTSVINLGLQELEWGCVECMNLKARFSDTYCSNVCMRALYDLIFQ